MYQGEMAERYTFPNPPSSLSSFPRQVNGLFLFLGVYQNRGRSSHWYLTVTASERSAEADTELATASTGRLQKKKVGCSSAALSEFVPSDVRCLTELLPSRPATISRHRWDLPQSSGVLCGLSHTLKDPNF